jgi:hypothetical protein
MRQISPFSIVHNVPAFILGTFEAALVPFGSSFHESGYSLRLDAIDQLLRLGDGNLPSKRQGATPMTCPSRP